MIGRCALQPEEAVLGNLKGTLDLCRTESDLLPAADPLDPQVLRAPAAKPATKRSSLSPTARSLKRLRELGYLCQVTEHWNQWARIRQDLFGFIDILAIRDGEILAIQACTRSDISTRVTKVANHENVGQVRKAGIRIEVGMGHHRSWREKMGAENHRLQLMQLGLDTRNHPTVEVLSTPKA
jgi:hypothetical protein